MNNSQKREKDKGINITHRSPLTAHHSPQTSLVWLVCFSAFVLMFWANNGNAQLTYLGNNYLEYSVDEKNDQRYFENWTEFSLSYQNWRAGVQYEIHLPPQPFSLDTAGQGIYQRYLEYRSGDLNMRVGNFYGILGRGLVFRSFDERVIRWDTNIDGIKFDYYHSLFDVKLMGGRPRDRSGVRHEVFQAGEVWLKPISQFHVGGSVLVTEFSTLGKVSWGSAFSQINHPYGDVYVEYALKDFPEEYPEGHAFYGAANLFVGSLGLLAEYKEYEQFKLEEGLTYNNPPTAVREHLYALLNRRQLQQNANDERGYLFQATYPVLAEAYLTLNYARTHTKDDLLLYEDYYGQLEWDYPRDWEWVWAFGRQKDLVGRYLNFVSSTSLNLTQYYSLKLIFEHQHAKVQATNRQYYDQIATLSFSRAPVWTFSILGERTTDQISEEDIWVGAQLDVNIFRNYDLTIFAGQRRKGKICLGGNCVVRPAFEGVEVILVNRF